MKTYKKRRRELKREAYMQIERCRMQIRLANWYLGCEDKTDEWDSIWYTFRQESISCAKELSQTFGYKWKKKYEEEI